MAYRRTILLAALFAMALFVLFYFELYKIIPLFYCDGFDCLAAGTLFFTAPLWAAILFFVSGAIAAKQRWLKAGCISAGIAFAFVAAAVFLFFILKN